MLPLQMKDSYTAAVAWGMSFLVHIFRVASGFIFFIASVLGA